MHFSFTGDERWKCVQNLQIMNLGGTTDHLLQYDQNNAYHGGREGWREGGKKEQLTAIGHLHILVSILSV